MSAVMKYFEDAKKRKSKPKKIVKPVFVEQQIIIDEKKLKDAYDTLKNWESEDSDFLHFVYENFDEDQYQYVLSKREDFSMYVKSVLWADEFNPPLGRNLKLKVREMTEQDYRAILLEKIRERNKRIDEELSKIAIQPMPYCNLYDNLNKLNESILEKENQLEHLKKTVFLGRYVPPNKRSALVEVNPEVVAMKDKIQAMKNEIQQIEDNIKVIKDDWERNQRFVLAQKIEQDLVMRGM
jgi:hypothetical protein